jgi:hypothetical protein
MGLVRQNVNLNDVKVSTCLLMQMRIIIFLAKLVFSSCRRFQDRTKSRDEVLCKIKEKFEILNITYGEECLCRPNVFKWHKTFKEGLRK